MAPNLLLFLVTPLKCEIIYSASFNARQANTPDHLDLYHPDYQLDTHLFPVTATQ